MAYLRDQKDRASPKSKYAHAIAYVLDININTSERTLRLCAIGRKKMDVPRERPGGRNSGDLVQHYDQCQALSDRAVCVRALLIALSSEQVDLESLLPDVWIAAHPEHYLKYRRDEAEAAAQVRQRCRARRRAKAREPAPTLDGQSLRGTLNVRLGRVLPDRHPAAGRPRLSPSRPGRRRRAAGRPG